MKRSRILLAAALASGVSALALGSAFAADDATITTNPGFKPSTGQINPGVTHQAPSGAGQAGTDKTAASGEPIPSNAEARAALMTVELKDPAIGQVAMASSGGGGSGGAVAGRGGDSGDPTTASQGHAAIGGPLSPGAGKGGGAGAGGGDQAVTTGAAPLSDKEKAVEAITRAAHETSPDKPIGSNGHTLPAKYSKRNATLDRVPMMAMPMRLTDEQRSRILKAAMDDKAAVPAGIDALKPASQLTMEQADSAQALPQSLADIGSIKALKYLKTKDKVLLIEPSTRIVVEAIGGDQNT